MIFPNGEVKEGYFDNNIFRGRGPIGTSSIQEDYEGENYNDQAPTNSISKSVENSREKRKKIQRRKP